MYDYTDCSLYVAVVHAWTSSRAVDDLHMHLHHACMHCRYRPIAVGVALTSFARKSAMLEYMCAVAVHTYAILLSDTNASLRRIA